MKKEELLRNYFLDTLTSEELIKFESLLKEDHEFLAQFEFEKSVKRVIKNKERKDLKQKLQELENSSETTPKGRVVFWKPLRIAASIAVVVSLGIYVFSQFNKNSVERLYADNYEKYPNTVFPIKRGGDQETSLEFKAFEAYESDNNRKAIQLFKELQTKQNPGYTDFYLGQSYLKAGDIKNAIITFGKVITENSRFSDESKWYLALAYLKNKEPENAIITLKEIITKGSYKSKEAEELLEALD